MSAVLESIGIAGVLRVGSQSNGSAAASAAYERPHVAVFGAVHGNEPCGLRASERLQAELLSGAVRLRAGTLFLVHGNPPATEQHERHTRGGVDLNRQFDYAFVTDVPRAHWVYEHQRALELKALLEDVDVVLDLHSTTAPSPAFAIATPVIGSQALADALGVAYVTQGWEQPGLLASRVVIAPLTQRGLPAVSVECGQHDQPASIEVAYTCLRRALHYLGLMDAAGTEALVPSTRLWLRAAIKRPSASFRFSRPLASMQQLAAGEIIGSDEDITFCAQRACYVIMPNDNVEVGDDMLYVAQLATESLAVP